MNKQKDENWKNKKRQKKEERRTNNRITYKFTSYTHAGKKLKRERERERERERNTHTRRREEKKERTTKHKQINRLKEIKHVIIIRTK